MLSRRTQLLALVLLLGFCASRPLPARKKDSESAPAPKLTDQQRALHALNRLTFGPRPGDVERVMAIGVDKWIDLQLHPEKVDNSAMQARLAPLRTLTMDTRKLVEDFPPQSVIKAVADGKVPMPSDPEKRAVYQAQLQRYRDQQQRKQEKANAQLDPAALAEQQKAELREQRMAAEQRAGELVQLPPEERFQELLRGGDAGMRTLSRLPVQQQEQLLSGFTPSQRETLMAISDPQALVTRELQEGKLLRAIYSERQLEEVMTDFWFNHFNVFVGKGADRYMLTAYERDVIRPHALGKFKDLLVATAKSPAMLFYLDNWESVGPDSDVANGIPPKPQNANLPRPRQKVRRDALSILFGAGPRRQPRVPVSRPPREPNHQAGKQKRSGLNENYARELMELHTLGVDGGYTQQDVTQVARVFTGWTLEEPHKGGAYTFNPRRHEPGTKRVLGRSIKERGEAEGLQVLEMLARHPSTAHFISMKLAQRFVSDNPPKALVDRMAAKFLNSDGDLREVLRTMFRSPEFWSPETYRAKVKTPLEFVVSAVRASGSEPQQTISLVQALSRMGMPLYGAQPPTGYPMRAEAWVSTSALLNRMNFAAALAAGRIQGIAPDPQQLLLSYHIGKHKKVEPEPVSATDSETVLTQLESALLDGSVSQQTDETIRRQLGTQPPANVPLMAGLLLGSPEFQRK